MCWLERRTDRQLLPKQEYHQTKRKINPIDTSYQEATEGYVCGAKARSSRRQWEL
ncbi:hypothetical protein DPMN_178481 [Dreissena polymorpha]|uniref:Uncharacterized protein n=1 Tax=Dreissena polymorpha TaxID=45954 RepID=A0A9D4EF48_DREPO|nr:hypothetical protein DPMN_178481 [Dreissena polymorpha]